MAIDKCECCKVMEIKVDNLEDDIVEFKSDVRNHLKEIRDESKQDRNLFMQFISELKESNVKLSTLMEKMTEQVAKQDTKLEKQDETIHAIGNDVAYLRQSMDANQPMDDDADKIWYRDSLFQVGKILLIILVVLLSVTFGIKIDDILGFLG